MKKKLKISIGIALVFLSGCTLNKSNTPSKVPDERPNIILILADDMGFSDLGSYGGEVATPHLDQLASNGRRFTQFYNYARCCPTRASLMTGAYPHQVGIGHMTNTPKNFEQHDLGLPEYRGFLTKNSVTIAEVLKEAGYATMMSGKWHLGISDTSKYPLQRGFEKFYGLVAGASNYFNPTHPRGLFLNNDALNVEDDNYYTTDAFTDYALKFIEESKKENEEKPFFLYLGYTAPHWPLQASQEDIDKYKGKYIEGWTALREARFQKMKELGIINKNWQLTEQDAREWDSLSEDKKKEMDLRRAIYSAMIDRMDQNIGRLLGYLENEKMMKNTLIIFLSDNGACAEVSELGNGPQKQLETKEGYFLTYGRAWANASNTPFKEYKHYVHEGGISTPFIVHWPKLIKEELRGKKVDEYGFLPDIMSTFIDVAKTKYPEKYKGNTIVKSAGKSLLPLLEGKEFRLHNEPIFWEHEGHKAVRLGQYKLVSKWRSNVFTTWELYDMKKDRTEMKDLSMEHPDLVNKMAKMYQEWATENNVLSWNEVQNMYSIKNSK